jgi:hypothetical protein
MTTRSMLAGLVLALISCGQKQPTLLEHIPQGAKAVLLVRQGAIVPLLQSWLGDPPEMKKELSAYLDQQLGIDVTAVEGIAVFVTSVNPPTAAALLRLPAGAGVFKGNRGGQHEGVDLFNLAGGRIMAARVSDGLLIGTPDGVRLAIDLSKKKTQALDKTGPLAAMLESDASGVEVLLGVSAELVPVPEVAAKVSQYGVRTVVFTSDQQRKLTLAVIGQADKLGEAKKLVDELMKKGLQQLEQQKAQAMQRPDVLTGAASIVGYHHAAKLAQQLEPKLNGDRLVTTYQIPSGNTQLIVAYAGIMAAVAIPSFIKYTRKSKTVESTEALDKMVVGAKMYFQADHYDQGGTMLPKQFPPASKDWVPARTCCQQGGKCQPDATAWGASPWRELHFQLMDPHYFQYRFVSEGVGKDARFIAEARGDLDCNGVFSNYKMIGTVDQEWGVRVQGPIVENETE